MTRAVLIASLCLVACDAKKEAAKSEAPNEAPRSSADTTSTSEATPRPEAPRGARLPDDLPNDLKQLAEMPLVTAEATPEEIERRLDTSLDVLSRFLELIADNDDCDRMGEALGQFAAVNHALLVRIRDKANDPALTKRLTKRFTQRGTGWTRRLADNLAKCATNKKVIGALMRLSKTQQ